MPAIHPITILLVGMITVVGMIVVLRLNAFLALITAAIVVSLLAPGEIGARISRVAEAFGITAGSIGIVIALAAIIGKAMLDSGAADRVVRMFLSWLGVERGYFRKLWMGWNENGGASFRMRTHATPGEQTGGKEYATDVEGTHDCQFHARGRGGHAHAR